jgi:glycine oxidase ThiO
VNPSVVIVGSGIIGCAIARELSMRGTKVIVLDPRPIAGGATQASAGMLAPYVEAHDHGPMLDLCVRSLDLYDAWLAALRGEGADVEYRRSGTLQIALTPEQADELRGGYGEWMEPAAVAAAVPALSSTWGALRVDAHGYVDAPGLARALAASAERRGARVALGRVERIDRIDSGLRVHVGTEEPFDVDSVVLAAGAWTNRIEGVRTPPLRPVRGQLLQHPGGIGQIPSILWGPDCYIVPRRHGLLIGATVEEVGFDERSTAAGVAQLFDAAQRLLPALQREFSEQVRVGLRPAAPDDLPVMGPDRDVPGLVHASGHYRNGVLLAPITAKLIADLVVDGARDPALSHFRPDRFTE